LDEYRQPSAFALNLRSAQDIRILRRPSWWTASRMLWIAAGLVGVVLITGSWGGLLSRKNQLLRAAQGELRSSTANSKTASKRGRAI
ncbi:MAG: hypothetical protein L0Z50_16090, partial [Verrucomicrobiales bacterium]|nr:hypothetical protein [Verrucomicrobiales bacterium]